MTTRCTIPVIPSQRGFSLVELAIVLVIVALLVGGLLLPLSTQMDIQRERETEKALGELRDALIGYAASHFAANGKPYLPCPDTDDDGTENRAGATCTSQEGRLPWADLGIGRIDPWNNRYRYRVTPAFADNVTGFTLSTAGTLRVCADSACASTLTGGQPAVFISHGKNGAGAYNASAGTNAAPIGANEQKNTDTAENDFVSTINDTSFDDIVAWLPVSILFTRLLNAGRLP